jgi:two-component system, chemotaxis family, sensor kinase CheA
MARDLYKYFRVEARELLDQLNRAVLDLEKGTTPELVAHLLRLAHTLKGAAHVVKQPDIGGLAHAIEDALVPLRESTQQATRPLIDTVLGHLDGINDRIATLSPPPEGPAVGRLSSEEALRTTRVDIGEIDTLLDGFAEVHAQLGRLRGSLKRSETIRSLTDLLGAQLASRSGREIGFRGDGLGKMQERAIAEQIGSAFDGFNSSFTTGIEQLDRELKLVRDAAERMRLIPADSLFVALERVARDAAQLLGKQVVFKVRGGEARLDAQVLGAVQAALSHAVRNAVVHGIETAERRQAAGKPAQGHISMEVSRRDRWIVFTCDDDGPGVDLEAVRRIAEQKRLLPAGAANAEALLQLLLMGGISTSGVVTDVAGRGVGLDVIRDAAARLEGTVNLRTEAGRGTTLTLTVPLSIAALDGLLVEAAGIFATIPIEAVRSTLRTAPGEIARAAQGESVLYEGRTIPFLPLTTALSLVAASARGNRTWSVVVVETSGGAAAIGVDRLLGVTNIVLRPLPALAPASTIVAGVSLDMEGNPQLVLDPAGLVVEALRPGAVRTDPEELRPTILVIDDSLTTRMLERSILESAGYEVELAVSGEEAIEMAGRNRYALFLVDVEMPGMDGFTFIEQASADPKLRNIPSILVTSRASPEDLQRGRDVGARGHIVKSEFDQNVLLARIGELVR